LEIDNCVNCDAGLLSVSDICPQCGWAKNKAIESDDADIENPSTEKTIDVKFKKIMYRPSGVRMLGMSYIIFGIIIAVGSIIYGSVMMTFVISDSMGSLGGIGGGVMPIPLPMDIIDSETISSFSIVNKIPGMDVLASTTMTLGNSVSTMDVNFMMTIMKEMLIVMGVGVSIGIIYFIFGRGLLKGNNRTRYAVIVSSSISIAVFLSFVGKLDLMILGFGAFNGLALYYMFKPHVREFFAQSTTKNSVKKSKIKK
jgi:hypothetical protein